MNTKKNRLFLTMLLIMSTFCIHNLRAQTVEINGFYGWQLAGKARLYNGDFMLQSAPNYGGKLSVGLSTTTHVEISYMRSDTEGYFLPYNVSVAPGETYQLSSNYINLGGLQEIDMGKIRPFGTFAMGLVIWDPKGISGTKVQFNIQLGGGLKIWLTENIGIRLQGSMMMPMVFNGVGFGCGIGGGGTSCGSSVYTRITPFQGEFSGGLILRISPN